MRADNSPKAKMMSAARINPGGGAPMGNTNAVGLKCEEIEPENYDKDSIKRCGGFSHKEEASRMLPRKEFFKNSLTFKIKQ